MLDSLVCSVDLYDLITLKRRKDKLVSLTMRGCGSELIPFGGNNAVRAAQAFLQKYGTDGADITVYKNIPMGLGLGGSSADAAGVLRGLSGLYGVNDPVGIKLLADSCGSDTKYMLSGGYARMTGRGDIVEHIDSSLRLDVLLLAPAAGVSTAECFKLFDSVGHTGGSSAPALEGLVNGDKRALAANMSNSLLSAARRLSEGIARAYEELSAFDPLAVNMTGSGSGVYAVFENRELRDYAASRYRGRARAYKLKTVL